MNSKSDSSSLPPTFDAEVLIVGAGPVGLLLANLLGTRGVRTVVCDQRTTPLSSSMAIGVTPPSLEIFKQLGLDSVFRDSGVPVRHAEVYEGRTCVGRLDFAGIASDYQFFLSIPQAQTVEILRKNLRKFSCVTVLDGVEFTGITQESDGVRVVMDGGANRGDTRLRARFVVGADGHRSAVRAAIGLSVRKKIYPQRFIMADFVDRSGLGNEARLFFTPEGSVESFPLPGGWRRWIVQAGELNGEAPEAHLIHNVCRLAGFDLRQDKAYFVSTFGAKWLLVKRYHAGRVLLAGDAAHVMSSIGGQGMNTGFADAEMLAEILTRVLHQPSTMAVSFAAYDRIRRRSFQVAAKRAERGMWLGTLHGRVASWFRKHLIRHVLFSVLMERRLAPHFAMLTIPYRNLNHVPRECLATD